MTRELRCTAGHVVGVRLCGAHTGLVALRHAGQEVVVRIHGLIVIRCACGAVYEPELPRLPFDDLELKSQTVSAR